MWKEENFAVVQSAMLPLANQLICPTTILWIRRKIDHVDMKRIAAHDGMHILKSLFYYLCNLGAQEEGFVPPSAAV